MTLEQMPSPAEPGKSEEPSSMASEQMNSPTCDSFKLLPAASEQMPLSVCDGSEPLPVALEHMQLPAAPETEQEPLPVVSDDVVACGAGDVTGAAARGAGADAVACVRRLRAFACSVGADAIARVRRRQAFARSVKADAVACPWHQGRSMSRPTTS